MSTVSRKDLDANPLLSITNIQLNVTYILAACLQQSFMDMESNLKATRTELEHENKRILGELIKLSTRFQFLVDELQKKSILTTEKSCIYSHDTTMFQYYSLLKEFISISGTDDISDIRAYTLWKMLHGFKHYIEFPNNDLKNQMAWDSVKKRIEDGEGVVTIVSTKAKKVVSSILELGKDYKMTWDDKIKQGIKLLQEYESRD
jgi:hypothetical protein